MQTQTVAPKNETNDKKVPKLNALNRCDRCGSQAYVHVELKSGNSLMFCNHHWGKVEAGIAPYVAKELADDRWVLTWNRHVGTENS